MRRATLDFVKDERGSEAIEMVASMAFLCVVVMSLLMILSYAIEVNHISYAAKRITRGVEITGLATQTTLDQDLHNLIKNADELKLKISVPKPSEGWFNGETGKIQLRQGFEVHIQGEYPLVVANPGLLGEGEGAKIALPLPIKVIVGGQVEHYWKKG